MESTPNNPTSRATLRRLAVSCFDLLYFYFRKRIFLRVGSPGNLTREHLALHPFGGRLMSISETPRRRVESPKQGNNWRPRVASSTESHSASVAGNPRGERSFLHNVQIDTSHT